MRLLSQNLNQVVGQKVLIRCNFDVPMKNQQVSDDTRVQDSLSTILALIKHQASQIILLSHQNRPSTVDAGHSLSPVAKLLSSLLGHAVHFVPFQSNYEKLPLSPRFRLILLDNLRFWPEETKNTPKFAQALSSYGDLYVNQAFANCHRTHASMVALPKLLPHFAGLNLETEVNILTKVRNHPTKPLCVVIGGAKLETKEPLIKYFAPFADHILVGGKLAPDLSGSPVSANTLLAKMNKSGKDISLDSAKRFAQIIQAAKTVIWNGPMGAFEEAAHRTGTEIVAKAVNQTKAFTLVGGGDTEAALTLLNLETNIDFISTGGGAMLDFLSHGSLIALDALN